MTLKKTTIYEFIFLLLTMTIYSYFALTDLGSFKAPESMMTLAKKDQLVIIFDDTHEITSIAAYLGPAHNISFLLEVLDPVTYQWTTLEEIEFTRVFAWNTINTQLNHSIRLTCLSDISYLMELTFLDKNNQPVLPLNIESYPLLFDEYTLYPEYISFRNSTYFDECYHARTAYEFLHGLVTYEISHPPLGKILIAIGVSIFGMTPFGYRIMGTLFGIFMILLLYFFAKKVLNQKFLAGLVCILFTFDFMHFSQTRIATIDVYVVFFILLMYYCMYLYLEKSYALVSWKKTIIPLGLCGLFMSLGIATKWQGIYAAIGLAILLFTSLFYRRKELNFVLPIILCCFGFFLVLPLVIYLLSYLPFVSKTELSFLEKVWENQIFMFTYHSGLESSHPYSSPSYSWPFILRPIWYYSGIISDDLREGISAFGNPLVWWLGIPAFIHIFIHSIGKKDRIGFFLIIGYLSQYLPWIFISRVVFIYHYFPSVIFVVLFIGYSLKLIQPHFHPKVFTMLLITYGVSTFGLFLLFYPVLSGQPIDPAFVVKYLRWLPDWVLIMP